MYIRSLEKMEEIVRNRDDLSWDGWDVLQVKPKGTAYMKKDAAYIGGRWNQVRRYTPGYDGYKVPSDWNNNELV